MGLLSWFKGNKEPSTTTTTEKPNLNLNLNLNPKAIVSTEKATDEVPDMNGAVEVSRPASNVDVTVFEFGSVAASSDKVTLAGYCPVSDEVEPCRWEILPATGSDAPQFRVVF